MRRWITLNEPFCSSVLGYGTGRHAPGAKDAGTEPWPRPTTCCWGTAWPSSGCGRRGPRRQFGITLNLSRSRRLTDSPADRAAADRSLLLSNLLFTEPVLRRSLPGGGPRGVGAA